jgi:hypothetical protein
MIYYTYDYPTGAYIESNLVSVGDLDPRDLGTVLLPGNATLDPPPTCSKGLWPFWKQGRWQVYEIVDMPDPYDDYDHSG